MVKNDTTSSIKKEISRLRSEVRKLQESKKNINSFSGMNSSTGNYWTATGMPWASSEGRKAVMTEYFWQPIRGQPRRVDTNELRQFSQTYWVSSCVKVLMDEISSLEWDIIPLDEYKYEWVEDSIREVKHFLKNPNKNNEPFGHIIRAVLKDILEIDAGVIVKVFDINSYDFENIEPKSGAPTLKPKGQRKMTELYARDGGSFLKEIDKFGFESGYWQYSYQIPAHPMWFNFDEIVYIQEHPRSMSCYGYARTQSILDITKSLHYSTLYNKRFFEETPIPDGALSLLDTNEMEMRAFMNYWNTEFKAQPHKLAILNKDIKWQPFAVSQRELEFLETQKWYYNLVISSFGLTPSELGITDDLNRATSATQSELVKRKGVRPFLKLLESYINKNIISEFNFEGIQFQFIYDDPAEKSSRLQNWNLELTMGVKTINEVRNEMGLEPIPNGDRSNNMADMFSGGNNGNNNDNHDENTGNDTEDIQSSGYRNQRENNESKNEKGIKKSEPDPEQLRIGIEIEREHQESLNLTDEEVEQIARDHLKEDKFKQMIEYLKELPTQSKIHETAVKLNLAMLHGKFDEAKPLLEEIKNHIKIKKGIDDGQYYYDQKITQPIRPSGAMFQPQNQRQGKRDGTGPYRNNPDCPNNLITCPLCLNDTLSKIESEEKLPEDIRCTSCGARFRSEDLNNIPNMELMYNYQNSLNKSYDKSLDDGMDIKTYCGFDVNKSFPFSEEYAQSNNYFKLLYGFLKDLGKKKVSGIVDILKNSLMEKKTIFQVAQEIDKLIDNYPRSQLIARTEIIRLANKGNIERMKMKGTKFVKWISAPEDGRLCRDCAEKNGKIYTVNQADGMIPLHPRCRCVFTEYEEI